MEDNIFLSVIVPVYKVEVYLKECIESVIQRSDLDIEILLIDDGSPDSCPNICDQYEKKDKRIRVFHKKNGGLSDARNFGLKRAKGKYIMFLDSDDYWDTAVSIKGMREKLEKKEPDVLVYGCKDFYVKENRIVQGRTDYDINYIERNKRDEVISYFIRKKKFPGAAWLVCVKREFLIKHNIFFKVGITAEDYDWLLEVFLNSEKVTAVNDMLYVYRYGRSGAITDTISLNRIDGIIYTLDKWIPIIMKSYEGEVQRNLLQYLCYMYCTSYVLISKMRGQDRKLAIKKMEKYRFLFQYGYGIKITLMRGLINIVGINGMMKILSIRNRLRD